MCNKAYRLIKNDVNRKIMHALKKNAVERYAVHTAISNGRLRLSYVYIRVCINNNKKVQRRTHEFWKLLKRQIKDYTKTPRRTRSHTYIDI